MSACLLASSRLSLVAQPLMERLQEKVVSGFLFRLLSALSAHIQTIHIQKEVLQKDNFSIPLSYLLGLKKKKKRSIVNDDCFMKSEAGRL